MISEEIASGTLKKHSDATHRQRLIFIHARERDRQLWLVGALAISLTEYRRRKLLIEEARKEDEITYEACYLSGGLIVA